MTQILKRRVWLCVLMKRILLRKIRWCLRSNWWIMLKRWFWGTRVANGWKNITILNSKSGEKTKLIIRIIIVILIFRAHSNILVQTTSFRIIIRRTITSAKKSGKTNFCSIKSALRAAKNRKNEEENKKMVKMWVKIWGRN